MLYVNPTILSSVKLKLASFVHEIFPNPIKAPAGFEEIYTPSVEVKIKLLLFNGSNCKL